MSLAHQPWTEFPTEVMQIEDKPIPTFKRMTVVERVYHQCGNHTTDTENRFEQILKSDEVAFQYPYAKLGPAWEKLYTGYVEDVGTVVIKNITGNNRQTIPTEEERKEMESRVILVGIKQGDVVAFAKIPPKQSFRVNPMDALYLRCANGQAEYSLFVIPK